MIRDELRLARGESSDSASKLREEIIKTIEEKDLFNFFKEYVSKYKKALDIIYDIESYLKKAKSVIEKYEQ